MIELFESAIWAIDPRYFAQHERIILKMIETGHVDSALVEKRLESRPVMQIAVVGSGSAGLVAMATASLASSSADKGTQVAVIPLQGPVTKNGGYCSYGSKDIIAWLDKANANADISAIVLHTDSPGGAVDGTEALANTIRNSRKPVVAFVDGLAASAAYWASSQAAEIYISSGTTAWAGSIGTLIQHVDRSGQLAAMGMKVTYITADRSTDKVKGNGTEPLNEEVISMFKADLNTINDTFIAAVEKGRGDRLGTKEDVFTAKVYNGKDAIKHGLVDKVGSLQDAIRAAAKLANNPNSNHKSSSNSKNSEMSKFPKLASLFGFAPSASAEVTAETEVTEANAATAEQAIAALETRATTAEANLATAQASVQTLTTAKTELETKVAQLETWKKNAGSVVPKTQDELNKTETPAAEKAPWEVAADKFRDQITS